MATSNSARPASKPAQTDYRCILHKSTKPAAPFLQPRYPQPKDDSTDTHGLWAPPLDCCALHGSSVARPAVTAATPAACGRTDCCRNAVVAATCGPVRSKKKKSNTERPDHTCCGPQLRQGQRHGLTRHPLQSHTHIHDFRPRCGPSFLPARGLLSPSSSSSAVHSQPHADDSTATQSHTHAPDQCGGNRARARSTRTCTLTRPHTRQDKTNGIPYKQTDRPCGLDHRCLRARKSVYTRGAMHACVVQSVGSDLNARKPAALLLPLL